MKRLLFTAIFSCIFLFVHLSVFGQPFTLVRDINLGPEYDPPRPLNLTEAGGLLYFNINGGSTAGLWKTDGSEAATIVLKSISSAEKIEDIEEVNNIIYFLVNNATLSSTSLWKSDGSIAGTTIIKSWSNSKISDFTEANGFLYFTILNLSTYSSELFKSDGTETGTTLITSGTHITNLTEVNGILFFIAANEAVPYYRLWKTDGTITGTLVVKDIYSGIDNPYFETFFNANGTLFFTANDRVNGEELWKSDGTEAGTVMIKDVQAGTEGSNIRGFTMLGSIVYFFANTVANGPSLWKTDGTSAGTSIITSFTIEPDYLTNVNGVLFFAGYDNDHGVELWKSDGTEVGTIIVKDINPGLDPNFTNSSYPGSLFNVNGILYFTAYYDNTGNIAIWKSDGTDAGTIVVKSGYKTILYPSTRPEFVIAGGKTFFAAFDQQYGYELWQTSGTTNSTTLVKNISPSADGSPQKFVAANGLIYFSVINYVNAPGPVGGRDVFQTNGTFSGTVRAERINGRYHSYPLDMINHNGVLFISGTNSHNNAFDGYELYKISSAGERQVRVKDINPLFNQTGSEPHNFQSVNQFLYFSANDASTGFELWKSDGTEGGTVLVKDINPSGHSDPRNLVNVSGVLYFIADDGTNGIELWKSDGTEAGTVLVKNISAGGNSNPSFLTNVNGILYFVADDGINGIELWKSDGTEAGTVLVKNINAGGNSNPSSLTNINGTLYFAADDGVNGVEVWKSNGSDAGTVLVKDIYSGPAGSNPASFINFNGIALFAADDGISGRELWGSIGTNTGTILIKDIQPGPTGSNPSALTKVGNNVLFAADDGVHGSEVWLTNSSEQGTRMMSEIEPGPNGSNPTEIFEYGAKVLVAATNEMVGSEVWIADAVADIVILPDAVITVNGPLAICNGGNITLKANTGNGYTYQWKKTGVNIAGAIQANYIANQSGSYAVVVTDAFGRTATSEVVVITTSTPPLATIAAAGPLSFCAGKNVLLKAVTGNGYTYQWKKAGTNIDNATSSNYTATAAGTYSVVVTNAGGCSATSQTLNVVVNAVPLTNVAAASSLTFCEGKTVQLKAITGNGYTYQWKRGGADVAGATSSNYTASTTGIYNVVITNTSGCSASSAGMTVVVRPLPAALITPAGPTTFCSGKNVLLKANTGTNYTYQWIRGAAPIAGAVQSNYSATQPGLYTVIVTNSSGCSVTSAAVAINVNPLPAALITPAGPTTFCAGQNVMLRANTGTNYTYQWKKSGVDIAGATLVNYTASAAGIYSVVVSNASGCPVVSAPVTVTVNNAPLASVAAAGPTTFCAGKNVLLKAINGAGYTYQWKKNGINIPQETTSNYTATAAGTYTVVVSNASGCSTTSTGIPVTVTMAPLATVAVAGPLTFCEGKNVLLKAITGTGYIYQWKKNGINIPAQSQSNFTATTSGVYTVAVTNAEGCSTLSSDINVVVTPAPAAIITPNGPLTFQQGGNVVLNASTAAGNTYQWKKDGVNISGATTESYTASISGSYTVVVTNANGCQANSQPAVVSVTQSRLITKNLNQEEQLIKVYPNPLYRNSYLNIDWNIPETDKGVFVTVYNMAGRKINSQLLKAGDKTVKITGASGIYLVECRWGTNKRVVFRVAKIE